MSLRSWGKIMLCTALGMVLLGVAALAQEEVASEEEVIKAEVPEKAEKIPQIDVLAHKEKAATSSVVTKEDISIGPSMNLPGYLEGQAGVDMTRRSFLGVRSRQLTLRGFDESRYQVYLNGRTFKGAGVKGGFFVDWSTITPADLERLEIIRGGLTAEYANTLGGVIIINTQRGTKEPKLYLDTYWGSWNTQNYRLLHTGSKGPVEYSLGVSYGETDGYLRNNFVRDRINVNTSLTYNFPFELSLTGAVRYITQETGWIVYNQPTSPFFNPNYPASDADGLYGPPVQYRDGGVPGPGGFFFGDNSYSKTQRWEWDLEAKQKFWEGEAAFRLFYFQATRNDTIYALNNPSLIIGKRDSWDEDTWGWNLKVRQTPHMVRMGFGLEGTYAGYGQTSYNFLDPAYFRVLPTGSSGPRNALKTHGGFLDAAIPLGKYAELYLGLRYDYYDAAAQPVTTIGAGGFVPGNRLDALGPRCTLTLRPTETTEAYLSTNYVTRFPTLPENYWFGAGYQSPLRSPYLSAEFGMQYEAGVTQQLPWGAQLRLRTYYYDINNYIRTVFGFAPSRVIYNMDLVQLRGGEVEGSLPLPYNLTAWANYTYQQTAAGGDPLGLTVNRLTELPEHKANLGLRYRGDNGAEAKIYLRMVSKRSEAQVTVQRNVITGVTYNPMKGFVTTGMEGRYPVANWQGFTGILYVGVDNLFGVKYQESYGFPMPTQTFYGGLQLRY
ncbi:MAG: TonB-dependent receptor [Deltaproteobacteria bacterium]|nr:TonB-dependent receptor [Deltaproteobacteria bacterium]